LAVTAAGGHPLAPFVVGQDGGGDHDEDDDAEENFHGAFRIARVGRAGSRIVALEKGNAQAAEIGEDGAEDRLTALTLTLRAFF
jgi:hypothetical protein